MDKETLFYIFLGMIAVVVVVFLNADKIWNAMDRTFMPIVDKGESSVAASSGSADAEAIRTIHIAWGKGNVTISYTPHNRITWRESFVQGTPSQFNVMQYWMNTKTLFINFFSQEYYAENDKSCVGVSKDLQVFIPYGVVLDEVDVVVDGEINCEVEIKTKDFRHSTATQGEF